MVWRAACCIAGVAWCWKGEPWPCRQMTSNRAVRQMEERIRELERQLGRKTLEVEILKEALDKSRSKKTDLASAVAAIGRHPMTDVASALSVSHSNLHARLTNASKPRRRY
jgi:putative transposase